MRSVRAWSGWRAATTCCSPGFRTAATAASASAGGLNRCENTAWYDATLEDGTCRFHANGQQVHHYNTSSFAQRSVVPVRTAIKVDPSLPLTELALMGCAVMTGVGAVINTARVRPGDTVAVVGCGGVGLNVVQGARIAGAQHDRRDRSRPGQARAGARAGCDRSRRREPLRSRRGGRGARPGRRRPCVRSARPPRDDRDRDVAHRPRRPGDPDRDGAARRPRRARRADRDARGAMRARLLVRLVRAAARHPAAGRDVPRRPAAPRSADHDLSAWRTSTTPSRGWRPARRRAA